MIVQYPYQLFVKEQQENVYDESKGDYNDVKPEWVFYGNCRDEGNGAGRKIVTTDGELYLYFWVIYCPISVPNVKKGSLVKVVDSDGNIRAEKRVTKFDKRQLNARIWL